VSPVDLGNGLVAAAAVALAVLVAAWPVDQGVEAPGAAGPSDGAIVDASGRRIAVRPYHRVVSASPLVDHLLLELVEPGRIAGVSAYTARQDRDRHRFAGFPTVERLDELERIVALRPDLIVVNDFQAAGPVARLREAGIPVLDLGAMTGVASLLEDARMLATALGVSARGERYAATLERRFEAVADGVEAPRSAAFVNLFGDQLYGGATGSSYHDLLVYAGLRDVAAEAGFTGWPRYGTEQLLALDPEIVVTRPGMEGPLCRAPGLAALRVCRGEGRFVAVEPMLLDDVGPGMLAAVEAIHDAVYGDGE
jgi:iron complex transport system substrate-binding protein